MAIKKIISVSQKMADDLARSGLTAQDAKRMKLKILPAERTRQLTKGEHKGFAYASYQIPYWDINGKQSKYYRIRFLDLPMLGASKIRKAKKLRYWQPSGTLPSLYLPPFVDWRAVAKNAETTIYITEGEKKSARACKAKLPCIGLGGVWSWRSAKNSISIIKDFDAFTWKDRRVVIVFDSDLHENQDVQIALNALAKELVKYGAMPYSVKLPPGRDNSKIGLDDYLEQYNIEAFNNLPQEQLLGALGEQLWGLNDELAYIEESEGILKFKTKKLINRQTLVTVSHSNRLTTIITPEGKAQQVSIAAEWLKWPHRRTHCRIAYVPGKGSITEDNEYNLWPGWGVVPKKGNVTPWLRLLDYVFQDDPKSRVWFEQWLAYPIQNPGTKLYTAAVLFSLLEGVGKSLIGVTMGRVYGANYAAISGRELHGGFNEWGMNKQFILGDDVTGSDRRADADLLKVMITREQMTIDEKYQPKYTVADLINYLFTTNQPDAFFMSNQDRRYFVHEITAEPLSDKFYKDYDTWLWSEEGPAALFHWLLGVNCASFNPKAAAPETAAKQAMQELSLSDVDGWTSSLRETPDEILRVDGTVITRSLWTTGELLTLYDPLGQRRTSLIALSKALRRAGFKAPKSVSSEGRTLKVWIIRDTAELNRAHHGELADRWNRERPNSKINNIVPLKKVAKF